jgi:hypothetical protein
LSAFDKIVASKNKNQTYLSVTNAKLVDPKFSNLENLLPPETKVLLEYFGSNLFKKEPFQTSNKLFYNNTCELKTLYYLKIPKSSFLNYSNFYLIQTIN